MDMVTIVEMLDSDGRILAVRHPDGSYHILDHRLWKDVTKDGKPPFVKLGYREWAYDSERE